MEKDTIGTVNIAVPPPEAEITEGLKRIYGYFPELDDEKRSAMEKLWPLYNEWNAKINVISRKDISNLYTHHVLHSLAIAAFLRERFPDIYRNALVKGGDIVEEMTVAAQKNKMNLKNFSVTGIDKWFKEDYFSEKKVIFICKSN